jgi:hypothetical protein
VWLVPSQPPEICAPRFQARDERFQASQKLVARFRVSQSGAIPFVDNQIGVGAYLHTRRFNPNLKVRDT